MNARGISKYRNKILKLIDLVFTTLFSKYATLHQDVFSFNAFYWTILTTNLASIRGKKIILNIHGGRFAEFFHTYPQRVSKTLSKASVIASPSRYLITELKHEFPDIIHIPNPILIDRFPYSWERPEELKLLWVRAFSDEYNPLLCLDILEAIQKEISNVKLVMVGPDSGALRDFEKETQKRKLSEEIIITGKVDNQILKYFFSSHSVFINTTAYESFGISTLEAALVGIPIVSSRVGELPYLWEDQKEIAFAGLDEPESFVQRILEIHHNPALAKERSLAARKKAEEYSWENISPLWQDLLKNEL